MSVLEQYVCHKNQLFVFRGEGVEHCKNLK